MLEGGNSLAAYVRLVKCYSGWRILWIGEILSSLGNWFAYVATLLLVERLAGGRGILLSVVLIMRFLPSLFLFPVAGVFADRYNRVNIMIYSCLLSACAAAALPVVQRPQELWLLYLLLFIEFACQAFYDPARRALTPSLVPRNLLHLATTIDSFAWSLTGAVGASLGGLASSRLSINACFFLDSATYLVAAACNVRLKMLVPDLPQAGSGEGSGKVEGDDAERGLSPSAARATVKATAPSVDSGENVELQQRSDQTTVGGSKPFLSKGLSNRQSAEGDSASEDKEESAALLNDKVDCDPHLMEEVLFSALKLFRSIIGGKVFTACLKVTFMFLRYWRMQVADREAPAIHTRSGEEVKPAEGCLGLVLWSFREEISSMKEGWSYIWNPANRDVLALTLLKAAGSLVWGAADVLNVRFSELPEMQGLGDAAFTLGLFFASVGFACLLGPIIFNMFTPSEAPHLLLSAALCHVFLLAGYLGMAGAHNVYMMCLSIIVKSFGSAVLWVYSTLLLQLRVPDGLLGRTMALEMAFFTVAESLSGLFGGFALDDLGMGIRQVSLVMALAAALTSCVWVPYALKKYTKARATSPNDL